MSHRAGNHALAPLFTWRSVVASEQGPPEPTTRLVLLTLSLYMNEKGGSCFPSFDTLAAATGLSRRAVAKHIKTARAEGWIVVDKIHRKGRPRPSNDYRAAVPNGAPGAPLQNSNGAPGAVNGAPGDVLMVHQDHPITTGITTKDHTNGARAELLKQASKVIAFLNNKTGQEFPIDNPDGTHSNSVALAVALLEHGYPAEKLRQVIVRKWRQWGDHDTRRTWLKPSTLFNPDKFEEYAAECVAND